MVNVISAVKETIGREKLISYGDHIILGLSGGPDSLCLFYVLLALKEELGFTMEAVHVNHKFRPGAAEEDAAFVSEICEKEGIACRQFAYDCHRIAAEEGLSLEEAGRKIRYEAFFQAAGEHGKIVTAHNAGDQVETMLLRLLRGTGPDGLSGMQYKRSAREGQEIIRPLLDVKRKDIEAFCEERNLRPRMDYTNEDSAFARNKVRNELIPYIEENFSPHFSEHMVRLGKLLGDDRVFLGAAAEDALAGLRREGGIDGEGLLKLEESIRSRALLLLMEEAGLTKDVSSVHVDAVLGILRNGKPSSSTHLPGGFEAVTSYGVLKIRRSGESGRVTEGKTLHAVFDKAKLRNELGTDEIEIRTRKDGDYIYISSGRKKIKDLFIDLKIPKDERKYIMMAAIGSEILWIPGIRYSAKYKVDESTQETADVTITI